MVFPLISSLIEILFSPAYFELLSKIGIKLNHTTAYHPQSDGQCERVNQCLENYLRCMTSEKPKQWKRWLPLAQWWYNSNFHTGIRSTPFEALFGYPPPQLPLGSIPNSHVAAVDEVLKERHQTMLELRDNLTKAQERMKRYADKSRTERKFNKGDWVYFKLKPYRQTSVHNRTNFKLSPKYFGPFEILEKVGEVAYRLNLPPGSLIHPVFHISQLKKRVGTGSTTSPSLPVLGSDGRLRVVPVEILGRRLVKKGNEAVAELLIKWSNLPESDATWEE